MSHPVSGIEQRLLEALPGLVTLDRNLEIEAGASVRLVDFVGVDPLGHLVLALTMDADGDETVLAVLDALAFARRNLSLFPRLYDASRLRVELPPKVVLVAPELSAETRERLAPLLGRHVELFEYRTLRSATGERAFLVRAAVPTPALLAEHFGTDSFLAGLGPEQRETARLLLSRMGRMDEQLRLQIEGNRLTWSLGDEVVVRLEAEGDGLLASVPPENRVVHLGEADGVESFLEDAMVRYAGLLELVPEQEDPEDPVTPVLRPENVGLLTPEEIAAFQE